jgi:glutathione S-transferase
MRLYAIPFTCSLAVRWALAEAGVPHELAVMRRFEHVLPDGARFDDVVNPKRRVPALLLPDGELLTEIVAISTHLDEATPRCPAERRRHLEWLAWLSSELHRPPLLALFDPASPPETVADVLARQLPPVLAHAAARLDGSPTLLGGPDPSPADWYLLWALVLLRFRFREQLRWPALDAFHDRLVARPAAAAVLADERALLRAQGGPR